MVKLTKPTYNADGEKIGSYLYDAWGNHTVQTVSGNTAFENSIVNAYNPQWGRFLNLDSVMAGASGSLHGYNLYAYCFNNPIMMMDCDGNWPSWNDIKNGFQKAVDWVDDKIIDPVVGFVEDVAEDVRN